MLHAVVREHLGSFLRHAEESYARALPVYVRRAFERYLRCGIPEHGFLRLRCEACSLDHVVAFSCKERGTCPSCAGRMMANTAAHLVDRVLPNVPIRQWVLSLPHALRALAARHPQLVNAIDKILYRAVERWMHRVAGPKEGRAGAVTFVQRFGGSLNLHVHFHVLFLEGLFTRTGQGAPVFHPAFAPTRADLMTVLLQVQAGVARWLATHPLGREEDLDADALVGCAQVAVQQGLFDHLEGHADDGKADRDEPRPDGRASVSLEGFNLHAAVRIGADDDVARERLVRYCARPPFALHRLSVLPDGRIAYQLQHPRKNATHRILQPVELLARIAALVPPPRHPFLRYHGVLAPSSRWRSAIVPRGVRGVRAPARPTHPEPTEPAQPRKTEEPTSSTRPLPRQAPLNPERGIPPARPPTVLASPPVAGRAPFATITEPHHARALHGTLLATSPRMEWSKLLRRTFAEDVLVCPRCQGRMRLVAAVQNAAEAARFLSAVAERSQPRPSGTRAEDECEYDDCPSAPPDD
ncbi:MAG: transposase [Myxococcales bacterium]|nr:transposase [Myxococcales bacterium]